MEKEPLLISACLLGVACRYDGRSVPQAEPVLEALTARYTLVPVCPEQLGGLPTPRDASERRGGAVVQRSGCDVTENYARGAAETLRLAARFGCRRALMKERSPSCGAGAVYDGSFSGTLTAGDGVTAEALRAQGIAVYGESRLQELLAQESES